MMRRLSLLLALLCLLSLFACSKADEGVAPPTTAAITKGSGTSTPPGPATSSPKGSTPKGTSPATTPPAGTGRGITGVSSLLAGNGSDSGKGVPGPALAVSLRASEDIAAAPNGDVYTIDRFGNRLLLVKGGQVTIAFNGDPVKENGFSGIAIDSKGRIVFGTDRGVNELKADGTATLIVDRRAAAMGTGYSMAFGPDDALYVSSDTHRVYRIDGATPTPIAGTGRQAPSTSNNGDGGPAIQADFTHIADIAVGKDGVVYVADDSTGRVSAIGKDGIIKTVIGGGTTIISRVTDLVPDGTPVKNLKLTGAISGIAVDAKGTIYVALNADHAIFRVDDKGGMQAVIADFNGVIAQSGKPANQTRVQAAGDIVLLGTTLFYVDGQDLHSIVDLDK